MDVDGANDLKLLTTMLTNQSNPVPVCVIHSMYVCMYVWHTRDRYRGR